MAKDFSNISGVSLGLRNNNPGNIIFDGTQWQGMTGDNEGFVTFTNIAWGLRALGKDLTTAINEGYNTITSLFNRYAPASDPGNDPAIYIQTVSQISGIAPDQILTADGDTLLKLIRGVIWQENGAYNAGLISDDDIKEGLSLLPDISFAAITGFSLLLLGLLALEVWHYRNS